MLYSERQICHPKITSERSENSLEKLRTTSASLPPPSRSSGQPFAVIFVAARTRIFLMQSLLIFLAYPRRLSWTWQAILKRRHRE